MINSNPRGFVTEHPRLAAVLTFVALLSLLAVVVLFAWNSFAVPVLELSRLQFKEAVGLTLLLAVAGRLLAPGRQHAHRDPRAHR